MSRLTESELKLGLPDEMAWEWVRVQLGPGPVIQQENHFFDREDRALGDQRIGVRLRSEGDRRTLTVKADRISGLEDPITHRLELEESIDPEEFERSLASGLALGPWIDRWRARPTSDPAERDDLAELLDRLDKLACDLRLQRYGGFSLRGMRRDPSRSTSSSTARNIPAAASASKSTSRPTPGRKRLSPVRKPRSCSGSTARAGSTRKPSTASWHG